MKNERIIEIVNSQLSKHTLPADYRVSFSQRGNGYGVGIRWPIGWAPGTPHLPQFREWAWGEGARVYGIQGEARIREIIDELAQKCTCPPPPRTSPTCWTTPAPGTPTGRSWKPSAPIRNRKEQPMKNVHIELIMGYEEAKTLLKEILTRKEEINQAAAQNGRTVDSMYREYLLYLDAEAIRQALK